MVIPIHSYAIQFTDCSRHFSYFHGDYKILSQMSTYLCLPLQYGDPLADTMRIPCELINNTELVVNYHKESDLPMKSEKCALSTFRIKYIGHVIRPVQPEVANHTIGAIRDLKIPMTQTELCSFIGSCNVFRLFVLNYAFVTSHLKAKQCKMQAKDLRKLRKEELNTLPILQNNFIFPLLSSFFRKEAWYMSDTYACVRQKGCVMLQKKTIK